MKGTLYLITEDKNPTRLATEISTGNLLQFHKLLMQRIGNIIGYKYPNTGINSWLEDKWSIDEENAELRIEDEDGDEYFYTISSYATLGQQLYWGIEDDLTFVLGYDSNGRWEDAEILILSTKNRIAIYDNIFKTEQ